MLVGDLLTTKEAAELLRVSHWTVSAWLSQGKLPRVKAGGRTLIAKADLEAFLHRDREPAHCSTVQQKQAESKKLTRLTALETVLKSNHYAS